MSSRTKFEYAFNYYSSQLCQYQNFILLYGHCTISSTMKTHKCTLYKSQVDVGTKNSLTRGYKKESQTVATYVDPWTTLRGC